MGRYGQNLRVKQANLYQPLLASENPRGTGFSRAIRISAADSSILAQAKILTVNTALVYQRTLNKLLQKCTVNYARKRSKLISNYRLKIIT